MLGVLLAAAGALGVLVAGLSGRIRQLPLSEPLLGLVAGVLLGPAVTGLLDLPPLTEWTTELHDATRILLAVSVMAVALRYPFAVVRERAGPVLLLLAVAMPVMAAGSAGAGAAALGLAPAAALLLGAAVSPTDPVLASSVVTGGPAERDVAARTRQLLSLESGANDGLALPLVLVALALGVLGAAVLARADGVLAVFVAGLAVNLVGTGTERRKSMAIDDGLNRFLVLPLFLVFGAALPWSRWAELGGRGVLLLVAVLLLRRLPVLLLLRSPLRLRWPDALFLGWFGPVGVSALFYLTLEAERLAATSPVVAAGALVVAGSTVAHGLTVTAGRQLYRRYRPTGHGR